MKLLLFIIIVLLLWSNCSRGEHVDCEPSPLFGRGYYGNADEHAKAGAIMIKVLDIDGKACGYYKKMVIDYQYFATR